MATTIRLQEGFFSFAQNGNIQCGTTVAGTWQKRDIWAENSSMHDKSGNKIVHYLWVAKLADGSEVIEYSRSGLRNALNGRKVTITTSNNNSTTMKKDKVYQIAYEYAQNECLDMQDEKLGFANEQIAELVQTLVSKLYACNCKAQQAVEVEYGQYTIKVRNARQNSFVSVSTGDCTGVAHSLAYITMTTRPITQDEVKELVDMINEAWYHVNN